MLRLSTKTIVRQRRYKRQEGKNFGMMGNYMKKLLFLSIILICMTFLLILSTFEGGVKNELISPLFKKEKVLGINQWFPKAVSGKDVNAPEISSKAAFFIDGIGGGAIFSKNIHERLPVASLVKVMTVLIALENTGMDEKYMVSQRATEMEPDEMILLAGETLTLKELLYGIFLISANDAAEVLAEGTLRQAQGKQAGRDEFIKLMNDKAKQLGMENSYFANPTGLDEDLGNSYSTAYDLAILTRYLIKNYPQVVDISKTEHIILPKTENHQDYEMYSGINLLTTYPGVVGFKTGYTPEAGLTLITLAQKNGKEVIGILLGSENRRDEARELLDYSFGKLIE